MKRIGILGGTFNPIHIGHLTIAQTACERLKLNKIIFVPSYLPPHKSSKNVIDAKHRYQMVRLAIKENKCFELSDYEIKKRGKSYSIDTVKYLHRKFPKKTKFFFIIGSDMLKNLHKWRKMDELIKMVSFVAVSRKDFKIGQVKKKVRLLKTLDLGISSSYIRRSYKSGHTARYLLPDRIYKYINKHKLYRFFK